ncbi:Nudix hydrolase [Hibiscus syriacus]|uniref:Nudix hydrolase n=1 Tax=Hibiscus syriacus TaxID=106335 RepID=A0A6A2ZPT3_HIBSY|nr:Nudix hydrolase [Hibiscus syriacus]
MDTIEALIQCPRQQKCKVLHLVRHGQAWHNVEGENNRKALLSPHLFDAQLTSLGFKQVAELRKDVHTSGLLHKIELVITSPSSRAMQTAVGGFGLDGHKNSGDIVSKTLNTLKIMAVELCRDRLGVRPCDKRRKVSDCQSRFPSIDFSMANDEDDNLWNPNLRESTEELAERVAKLLKWLWTRPEKEIVIVSHGIVLQQILINLLGNDGHPTVRAASCRRFGHCELRSVVILDKRSGFAHGGSSPSPSLGCGQQEDDVSKVSGNCLELIII